MWDDAEIAKLVPDGRLTEPNGRDKFDFDVSAVIRYCKQKGIDSKDLTEAEIDRFRFKKQMAN